MESVLSIIMNYRTHALGSRPSETTLTGLELGAAWDTWREDFVAFGLTEEQRRLPRGRQRSCFNAHIKQMVGDTHLARALLQHGIQPAQTVQKILQSVKDFKEEARRANGGASEPAEIRRSAQLRGIALTARRRWRQGKRLSGEVHDGTLQWRDLTSEQQILLDEFVSGRLACVVDKANAEYRHGIARTHDYGFAKGDDMREATITEKVAAMMNRRQRNA